MRLVLALCVLACAGIAPAAARAAFDVDGDRRDELAAGMPSWDVGSVHDVGAVVVIAGASKRRLPEARLVTESMLGVAGGSQGGDRFGEALAGGDFSGDGYDDLAMGAPRDPVGAFFGVGVVTAVYGSARGLAYDRPAFLTGPLPPSATARRSFGYGAPLAAADLDRDGFDDLVSRVDQEPPPQVDIDHGAPGALQIMFGSPAGLTSARVRTISGPALDAGGFVPADLQRFGEILAVGDVNHDGFPDIAEAVQGDPFDLDGTADPGHVGYCAGGPAGPTACRLVASGLGGAPASLAIGDVDGDGYGDIVGGSPEDRIWGELEPPPAGAIRIWRGGSHGPRTHMRVLRQGRRGVKGRSEHGDEFGSAIAVADLDGDARAEIVAGAPGEDRGAGRVTVIRGPRSVVYDQTVRHRGRRFGAAVAVLDFDGDGRDDLAAGAPGDPRSGSVTILRGTSRRFKTNRSRVLGLRALGLPSRRERDPYFGVPFGARLAP